MGVISINTKIPPLQTGSLKLSKSDSFNYTSFDEMMDKGRDVDMSKDIQKSVLLDKYALLCRYIFIYILAGYGFLMDPL